MGSSGLYPQLGVAHDMSIPLCFFPFFSRFLFRFPILSRSGGNDSCMNPIRGSASPSESIACRPDALASVQIFSPFTLSLVWSLLLALYFGVGPFPRLAPRPFLFRDR